MAQFYHGTINIPFTRNLAGVRVIIDQGRPETWPQIFQIYEKFRKIGTVFGKDEMPTLDSFCDAMKDQFVLVAKDESSDDVLGAVTFRHSPLARSTQSNHSGGYILVEPGLTNHGVGMLLANLYTIGGMQLGFVGMLARTGAVNTKTLMYSKKTGNSFIGVIPSGMDMEKIGLADDLITYRDYTTSALYKVSVHIMNSLIS